jgi:hypothetical protein
MGWTFISRKIDRKGIPAFLKEEFAGHHEILDCAVRNNEAYLAVKNTNTNEVSGWVVLLSFKKNETGYKDMNECEGPYYFNCPKRIIKRLSPTEDARSVTWRNNCLTKVREAYKSSTEAVSPNI